MLQSGSEPFDRRFLANPQCLAKLTAARAIRPPPPVDLLAWARANVRFGGESPFPGPYDPRRFPFFARILECLSPEDPARVVVLRKSAQIGGTVLAEIFLGATQDLDPGSFLYVHPTEVNAHRWVREKWWPMVRQVPALTRIFEGRSSKEGGTSVMLQERRDGRGILIVSGANSASSLSMISARRQVQDDLSKWGRLHEGDPEGLADDRSKAFVGAKLFKISTPDDRGDCKITRAFLRGTQEYFHVPCPHCGHKQPLEWEDFRSRIEEDVAAAYFVCVACSGRIEERHRRDIVAAGEWVARNPNPEPGWVSFHLWAAYPGIESWAQLARLWRAAQGDLADEKRVTNTTGGEAYEQPGDAPEWGELKARADSAGRPLGQIPRGAHLVTLTFDCQDDYIDGQLIGWGRNLKAYVIERLRIEGHISEPETRAELDQIVNREWPTESGRTRRADLAGIDANAWTDDVFDWARKWPKTRVVMVRGDGRGDDRPTLALVRKERRRDGKVVRYQGRFYNIGVNGLKAALYKALRVEDTAARSFVDFPAGLDDDYYEQLTAERRMAVINPKGFTTYQWKKAASARNEMLDVFIYGMALAGKLGWRTLTDAGWDRLDEREAAASPVVAREEPPPVASVPTLPAPPVALPPSQDARSIGF